MLDVPKAAGAVSGEVEHGDVNLLVYRDIVTDTTVLACNTDALRIIWGLGLRVEWRAALGCSIVVIVLDRVSEGSIRS